ncbi:hypothetical protein JVU11DRAFT_7476 [Chiua virens]|nr:hypothetical protein JVU11DRAFT_7476 [Chiua virens]
MDQQPEPMPDFAADNARPLRDALILAFNWDEEQAIRHLQDTWRQAHPEQEQPADPPAREPAPVPEDKPRNMAKPAQDKKKSIADFDEDMPPPSFIPTRPSQYALSKLEAFEYVELWYFTKEGCFEAAKQARSQPEDAYGLLSTEDILTLRPVTSVKASRNAKSDHELSLTEMLQARTSYLEHVREAGWPEKHINALFKFFWNLESHPYCSLMRHGDRILATYAAKTRRLWHDKLKLGLGNAFNIALINDHLMQQVVTEVNDAMLGQVSPIPCLFRTTN